MTNAFETLSIPMPDIELPADPFASDLFGSKDHADVSDPHEGLIHHAEPEPTSASWTSRLPKVRRRLLAPSFVDEKIPDQIPVMLCAAIEEALHEVVFADSGPIQCEFQSIAECDVFTEAAVASKSVNLALPIVLEQAQAQAVVMVGGGFVRHITDKIFGPSGYSPSTKLSPIEIAITEFLTAKVVAKINDGLGNALFSVGEALLRPTELFHRNEAGAKACLEVHGEGFTQVFRVLISQGFFSGLKDIGGIFESESDKRKNAKLFRAVRAISLRAQIGSTRLDSATLSFLEPGDIVIVENSQLDLDRGSLKGEVRMLAGAGTNFVVTGELTPNKRSDDDRIRVLVKDISSKEAVKEYTGRLIMEDKKTDDIEREELSPADGTEEVAEPKENNEMSAAVENLQLRLRVELAGNKMSLREINDLRVGQVIDLGRGANDSVSLVTDGSDETVAIGELVDIDGSLGVRLTKVFL